MQGFRILHRCRGLGFPSAEVLDSLLGGVFRISKCGGLGFPSARVRNSRGLAFRSAGVKDFRGEGF